MATISLETDIQIAFFANTESTEYWRYESTWNSASVSTNLFCILPVEQKDKWKAVFTTKPTTRSLLVKNLPHFIDIARLQTMTRN